MRALFCALPIQHDYNTITLNIQIFKLSLYEYKYLLDYKKSDQYLIIRIKRFQLLVRNLIEVYESSDQVL